MIDAGRAVAVGGRGRRGAGQREWGATHAHARGGGGGGASAAASAPPRASCSSRRDHGAAASRASASAAASSAAPASSAVGVGLVEFLASRARIPSRAELVERQPHERAEVARDQREGELQCAARRGRAAARAARDGARRGRAARAAQRGRERGKEERRRARARGVRAAVAREHGDDGAQVRGERGRRAVHERFELRLRVEVGRAQRRGRARRRARRARARVDADG